jgi:hypothetical protein
VSLGGAGRRLLDPWAGLVLAALIVLGVVILLATPGPWRAIGREDAPVTMNPALPSDVVVYILAGPAAERCTAVVWLHVDHRRGAVTAVLVPPETRCFVAGGGYAPIRRLVTDLDPQAAVEALGGTVGVEFGGWATVDRAALVDLCAAAGAPDDGPQGRRALRAAVAALTDPADDLGGLRRQREALERVLHALPHQEVKANAVVNYVLGSEDVVTDLDLRAASGLVKTWRAVRARDVAVGVAAAVVETCGPAESWRLDRSRLEVLRLSLALGLGAPPSSARVRYTERAAEVLVVSSPSLQGRSFAVDLRDALEAGGALQVAVRAASTGGEEAGARLASLVASRRPLAVVLAPRVVGAEQPSAVAAELEAMVAALRTADQPCVIVGEDGDTHDEIAVAIEESGVPVVAVEGTGDETARLVAGTVARACWPDYLAPALTGTVLEFSYAARHGTAVALAGSAARDSSQWLTVCGYQVSTDADPGWQAPEEAAVAYRPGSRRAALTAAGDLAWGSESVRRDPSAPAAITVVWPAD